MNSDKDKKRTKSQKPKEPKKKVKSNEEETVTVTIPESMELSKAMNDIFGLPDDGKSTGQTFLQSMESIEVLEESLNDEAEKEARFKQLMDFYKKQPLKVDMPVTQEWLEKHYGHLVPPPPPSSPLEPYSPPPVTQADPIQKLMAEVTQEEREKANADYINGGILPCPFHPRENVPIPIAVFGLPARLMG